MLIHDIDTPQIYHANALERRITEYTDAEKFSVIVMNPPYGGTETDSIKTNFPADLRGSETADLFLALILYRLKNNGRAGVIIPDGFLFGTDGAKLEIKKRLLNQFNLHTIIRLPQSVFAPYTSITTIPPTYKHFSKTKPMEFEHFQDCIDWWDNKSEIKDTDTDTFKAKFFSVEELISRNYDLDLCGFPSTEEKILSPQDTIQDFHQRRDALNAKIDLQLEKISTLLQNV